MILDKSNIEFQSDHEIVNKVMNIDSKEDDEGLSWKTMKKVVKTAVFRCDDLI